MFHFKLLLISKIEELTKAMKLLKDILSKRSQEVQSVVPN